MGSKCWFFLFLMNNYMLLFVSFFIIVSCLSENFEFLVHNEESLLLLCFVSFIFFAYSFLSVIIFEGFQNKVLALETQFLTVVSTRFKFLTLKFNDYSFGKGLLSRFQFLLVLTIFVSKYYRRNFDNILANILINCMFLVKLNEFWKTKNQNLKLSFQSKLSNFSLSPFLFNSLSFSSKNFFSRSYNETISLTKSLHFFRKSSHLKQLYL